MTLDEAYRYAYHRALELDFRGDGTIDYRERLPSARWQPLSFLVTAPSWYDTVALTIRKESHGHAVLARLELGDSEGCTGRALCFRMVQSRLR